MVFGADVPTPHSRFRLAGGCRFHIAAAGTSGGLFNEGSATVQVNQVAVSAASEGVWGLLCGLLSILLGKFDIAYEADWVLGFLHYGFALAGFGMGG